ncbi:MAG: glycosyltransferase family 4 protein [Patescibacteria group bacterium]
MSTGIVIISNYMKEHYVPYKKKILVAHDAVSLERFAGTIDKVKTRAKLGFGLAEKICVYAGTISQLKGINYVLTAARILPEVSFVLIGPVSSEFTHRVLLSNVKFFGRVEQKDLPGILQSADVLLLPHPRGEYSQSPMKLFEYMASGVPIVASRLPSISEVLNDKNAVLVEPESGRALVDGIKKILDDTHHSQALAKKAYDDVQNYTWKKRGLAISEFIENNI